VRILGRRPAAVLLTLALSAGNAALCAGWLPTPEARMACCLEKGRCPMHTSDSRASNSVTQAEADGCCATSEKDNSGTFPSTFVLTISLGIIPSPVQLVVPETAIRPDAWRTPLPRPGDHVPAYLLHSVFLV
jgi:hypothetical protein